MKTVTLVRVAVAAALFVSFGVLGAAYKVGSDASEYLRTISTQRQWQDLGESRASVAPEWADENSGLDATGTASRDRAAAGGGKADIAVSAQNIAIGQRVLK